MVWRREDPQGNETGKIKWELVPYTRGKVLNIGAGPFRGFPHFITLDSGKDTELFGTRIVPDIVCQADDLSLFASQSVDAVFSSHCLEHIEDHKKALKEWWRVIKPGGHLCLYLPHKDFYPNIGQEGANPDHKHDFLPTDIVEAMRGIGVWDLVENQERNEGNEYSFFQVFKKRTNGKCEESWRRPRPEKTACVVRYGAFGDLLQASSVFAGLKKQGYHVTLMSSPPGSDVVKHDPNIDHHFIQDKDQVPNQNLPEFWAYWAKKFDKFVNLSESVEASLLAMPGRTNHGWPAEVRRKMLNHNYVQFQHDLAGLPHEPRVRFYATPEERAWAKKERAKMGELAIMWVLAGSSVHKTNSALDVIAARILTTYPQAHIVLVGGPECTILEAGWEKEPRVHLTCGKWGIRQSLAMLDEIDLVIGGETGVMNGAAHLPAPKVLFLSHSSHENLSRDWVNTAALAADPKKVPCYPCHRLHYSWDHCFRDEETGTAKCQVNIDADVIWPHVVSALEQKTKKAA